MANLTNDFELASLYSPAFYLRYSAGQYIKRCRQASKDVPRNDTGLVSESDQNRDRTPAPAKPYYKLVRNLHPSLYGAALPARVGLGVNNNGPFDDILRAR
jgi:hypothetical protein